MKIHTVLLFSILLFANTLSVHASYRDHRNRKVDSLENVLRNNKPQDKIELIRLYSNLAWGYLELDGKKATHYSDLGIPLCEEVGGYLKLNDFHRIKGMVNWGGADYKEAEKEFQLAYEAVEMMRKSGKYDDKDVDDQESALCGSLGNLYNTLGEGAKALKYYHKALILFEKHDWKESQATAYSCMADLYYYMGNIQHSWEYLQKSDSISILSKDSLMQSEAQRGLAKICKMKGEYEDAWKHIQKTYDYVFAHPEDEGSSRRECLIIMTDIAMTEGNWQKAEKLLSRNEELCKELNCFSSNIYSQKAAICINKGKWKEAETYALKASTMDTEAPDVEKNVYKLLSNIYSHLGNPDKAKVYADKADSIQTSWSNYAYQASLSEQEMKFESEKKDITIASLSKEKIWIIAISVICGILLITAVAIATVIMIRRHRRQKAEIASQVALETEKRERQIFAKDLHDGLGGLLSLLKLKIANNEKDAAIKLVDESTREMRRVAHHIMPDELQRKGLVTSLSNLAVSVPGGQFQCLSLNDEQKDDKPERLPQDIELVLYRCAYELVNNAIKHASADIINIQLMIEDSQVMLSVSDNGKGIDQSDKDSGMGLQNLNNRINEFNGKMELISAPELGTEINIILPISKGVKGS